MKHTFITLFSLLLAINCYSQKKTTTKKEKGVGTPQLTANPNTPYIYKNGYSNYEIVKLPITENNATTTVINELRFNAVLSAMYTKNVMYNKFGRWTKESRPNNERHPILIWKNVKIFDNDDKLFTVYTNGYEDFDGIYASVIIFDQQNKDCMEEDHPYKAKLIEFFSNGIKNIKHKDKFYDVYWKDIFEFDKKQQK